MCRKIFNVQLNKRLKHWSPKISQCFINLQQQRHSIGIKYEIQKITVNRKITGIFFPESSNPRLHARYYNSEFSRFCEALFIAASDFQISSPYPERPNTLRALNVVARATSSGVLLRYAAIISTVTGSEHGSFRWSRKIGSCFWRITHCSVYLEGTISLKEGDWFLCEAVLDMLGQLASPGVGVHEGGVSLHQQLVQGDHAVLQDLPHPILGLVFP